MKRVFQILLCWLALSTTQATSKDVLVLLPLVVDKTLNDPLQIRVLGAALENNLSNDFEVYFGDTVEEKLALEYKKENCTAQSCAENLAVAFNGELIGDASIGKLDDNFIVQVQIKNIVTGQLVESVIEVCEACSPLQLFNFIKQISITDTPTSGNLTRQPALEPAAPPVRIDPAKNSIKFDSMPSGARLWINNNYIGKTPIETNVEANQIITVEVRKAGFAHRKLRHRVGLQDWRMRKIQLRELPTKR